MAKRIPGTGSVVERRRALTRQRREQLLDLVSGRAADGEAIHLADVVRELGASKSAAEKLLAELTDGGDLIRLAFNDGWTASGAEAARIPTFADIVALARRQARPDAVARKGRQADDVSRDIETITLGQLADVERLAKLILRHTPAAGGDLSRVSAAEAVWVPELEGGRGGWALQAPVQQWVEAEHRARYEARQVPRGSPRAPWTPARAEASVRDYRGAVNNLLFLAATHGLISRSPRNTGGQAMRYAPSWVPIIDRLARQLLPTVKTPKRIPPGLRTLAIYATGQGGRSLRTTDWLAVRAALFADYEAGRLPREGFSAARYAWRAAVTWLQGRIVMPPEFQWAVRVEERTALVPQAAIATAGVAEVGMAARDFTGWRMRDGRYPTGLVESPYGLRAYAAWSSLPESQLRRQTPALPPRTWSQLPTVGRRKKKYEQPSQVTTSTLQTRLRIFAHVAGYAAAVRGVDFVSADLRALCDPSLVDEYLAWRDGQPKDARGDRRAQILSTVQTLGFTVNGFLCAVANQVGTRAELAQLQDWYRQLEQRADERELPDHKDLNLVAGHIVEVAAAWRGTDQVEGLLKVSRLVDALTEEFSEIAGGRTLTAQYDAIVDGSFTPTRQWAELLRLAVVLVVLQRIPLRGHAVAQLTTPMWEAHAVGAEHSGRPLAPWEGAIRIVLPRKLTKAKRPFAPPLILPAHVRTADQAGSESHEVGIRRPLLALWFCAGGGRDICRSSTDPVSGRVLRQDVPWVFPDARTCAPGRPSGQWSRAQLSNAFKAAVLRHSSCLGLQPARLRGLRGALGLHVVRRLFGTYWAPRNLVYCSRLLDHVTITFTASVYAAQDERTMSLDAEADAMALRQMRGVAAETAPEERLALLRLIDRLQAQVAALEAALAPDEASG